MPILSYISKFVFFSCISFLSIYSYIYNLVRSSEDSRDSQTLHGVRARLGDGDAGRCGKLAGVRAGGAAREVVCPWALEGCSRRSILRQSWLELARWDSKSSFGWVLSCSIRWDFVRNQQGFEAAWCYRAPSVGRILWGIDIYLLCWRRHHHSISSRIMSSHGCWLFFFFAWCHNCYFIPSSHHLVHVGHFILILTCSYGKHK